MNDLLKDKRAVVVLGAVGAVIVLAAAWLLVVSPQRSKASDLKSQVAAAQSELAQRRLSLATPSAKLTVKAGDTYRLAKALPDATNMAGVILDLNGIAARHKLAFTSISPGPALPAAGYVAQPVNVELEGRFSNVSAFLGDLRRLVRVRHGRLDARGRIYSTTSVNLTEAPTKFPNVKAAVTIQSFTFSAPVAVSPTTPPSTSTDSASNATVAAGATP